MKLLFVVCIVVFFTVFILVADNVKKGSLVHVEGKISTRSYEDKDGNKEYITEIIATKLPT